MNDAMITGSNDWRCPYCGELVLAGNSHVCHNQYQSTYPACYDPGVQAQLKRIADMLEKFLEVTDE